MERFKRKVLNKFLQIIRQAYTSVVSSDSNEYPQGQVTANSKATKIVRLSTYGLIANPPLNSHVLMFQSQGQESTKFGIFNDFLRRKKGLAEGECALYNTMTGAIVHMKADGSIFIDSPDASVDIGANTEVNVTAPTVNVDATTEANVTAPVINIIASTEVNVTAPNVNVTASTKAVIDSPAVELGDGALEKLVNKVGMLTYNNHDHPYIDFFDPGVFLNSTTGKPNQLMVEDTDTTTETKAS